MTTLYEAALEAIQRVFSDRSKSQEEVKEDLRGLRDEIDILLDTLN